MVTGNENGDEVIAGAARVGEMVALVTLLHQRMQDLSPFERQYFCRKLHEVADELRAGL